MAKYPVAVKSKLEAAAYPLSGDRVPVKRSVLLPPVEVLPCLRVSVAECLLDKLSRSGRFASVLSGRPDILQGLRSAAGL